MVDTEAAFTRLTLPDKREMRDTGYGGSFTEFGSYCLLPILRFKGDNYKELTFQSLQSHTGVDGYTKAYFTYENGFATAKTGLTAKSEGQLLITGTKGYILAPSPWWLTRYFEVRYEDASVIERYSFELEGHGLRYEIEEFVRRIEGTGEFYRDSDRTEAIARAGVMEAFFKNER